MNIEIDESPSGSLSLLCNKERPPARLLRLKRSTVPVLRLSWPPSLSSTRSFGDRINKTYCSLQKPCRIFQMVQALRATGHRHTCMKREANMHIHENKSEDGLSGSSLSYLVSFFCLIFDIYTWLMVRGMHSDGRRWIFGCVHLFVTSCEVAVGFTL